ncbi:MULTISPECIES: hypothetical protein [unclassified Nostoc]|uniref:hypothetical protein n=1 Tax=unclassified Nostoc TaxID=2593658 RepID=UPI001D39DB46|nr:hypothetical protein [Nostoc sp. JL23]MBN3877307.1 hypothetical protein [Nostoc sp. JL23]
MRAWDIEAIGLFSVFLRISPDGGFDDVLHIFISTDLEFLYFFVRVLKFWSSVSLWRSPAQQLCPPVVPELTGEGFHALISEAGLFP